MEENVSAKNIKIAPLMRIEFTPQIQIPDFDIAIFTSPSGVNAFNGTGGGRVAYCVGDRTAKIAQDMGFAPVSAKGGATNLVALLRDDQPQGRICHFRGAKVHQSIAEPLSDHGMHVFEKIVYQQVPQNFDESTLKLLANSDGLKIPLFSKETARQFEKQVIDGQNCDIFCISKDVQGALNAGKYHKITVISEPTQISMVQSLLAGN
ncbi:hypothetical protein RB2150_12066 [Rhodobacteraceae bacterium HTCC2150]|nr:hypothetical protein RB2150_12066 [Rhodobacteraceae bacterium HTCC2150]